MQNARTTGLICLGLGLLTLLLYLPSLRQDFLPYDDQQYVTENLQVQAGVTWRGLVWAFGYHAGNWHPLTWLSHMLDCQLYGLKPAGHHLTNVLLHVANTLLLFLLLNRMTRAAGRSAAVAALFAWHPLHVESVAWVAERKDVLSACFWMLTLLAYVYYAARPGIRRYVVTLVMFTLALMAKPMAVTLPFVLVLLDFWPLKRLAPGDFRLTIWPLVREKTPFFAMSAAACALTLAAQEQAIVSTAGLPIAQRIGHALVAYTHYLGKTFLPRGLAIYYPYEVMLPTGPMVFAGILLVLITALVFRFASRRPYLVMGWLWYLGTLVPVIGLVQVGDQAWADRYTYLPLIGVFMALVWSVSELARAPRYLAPLAMAVGLALLAATTVQLGHWKNTRTLFEHAAQVVPKNYMAVTMLGSLRAQEGKLDEAIEHYTRALQYKPEYAEAYFFLGNALDQQGKLAAAVAAYRQALRFRPIQEQTHILLGVALAKQQKFAEARGHYEAALKLNPESAAAHNNLARVLHSEGRLEEAIEHFYSALKFDPHLAQAQNNLGILLIERGQLAEGTIHLRTALRLNPANRETQFNLALALNQQGRWDEAAELFAKTVGGDSTDPKAHYQFAVALGHLDRTREAMSQYASVLLLQPDHADALDGLSWILATSPAPEFRNGAEAVNMAARACELTQLSEPAKLKTLAAAYAEAGRFPEAIATAERVLVLAANSGRKDLTNDCQIMLENFKATKPWREAQVQ
jgi:protein O-mannosyl-transferase